MNDTEVVQALLLESHRCVSDAAEETVMKIGSQSRRSWIVAPKDDRDRDLLHDGFLESCDAYEQAIRRRKGVP